MKQMRYLVLVLVFIVNFNSRSELGEWINFNTKNSPIPSDTLSYIFTVDSNSNIWINTIYKEPWGNLIKYDGKKFTLIPRAETKIPDSTNYTHMIVDQKGTLWIAANGLLRYDGKTWKHIDIMDVLGSNYLALNQITGLACSKDSILYVTTTLGIIKVLWGGSWLEWRKIDMINGKPYSPFGIAIDNNNEIWFGTNKGLVHIANNNLIIHDSSNSPIKEQITSFTFDEDNNLWLVEKQFYGKKSKLLKYDGNKWHEFTAKDDTIFKYDPLRVYYDRYEKKIWISFSSIQNSDQYVSIGIANYDGSKWELLDPSEGGFPNLWLRNMVKDKHNNLWMVTYAKGLMVYKKGGVDLSIKENNSSNIFKEFSITPNPAGEYIEITFSSPRLKPWVAGVDAIKIFNQLGECVMSAGGARGTHPFFPSQEGNVRIDVSGLPAGVYFVRIGDWVGRFLKI